MTRLETESRQLLFQKATTRVVQRGRTQSLQGGRGWLTGVEV